MTDTMLAAVASETGPRLVTLPRPEPGPGEVLVRVEAAGMNRADGMVASGAYGGPASLGKPVGFEWAGEVVALGAGVTGLSLGQRVMASGMGGFAEYAVSDAGRTVPVGAMEAVRVAGLPLALITAYDAVALTGGLEPGGTVLVQGASSAVGLMALQIARHRGASVIVGTSSHAGRRARLGEFGATLTLDTKHADWPERVLEATGGAGVGLVVDMVSGETVNGSLRATAIAGRIVNVGRLGGAMAPFDFNTHAARRIDYRGVTFRTRSAAEVRAIAAATHQDLMPAVAAGTIGLPLERTWRLDEVVEAMGSMSANAHFGKMVILP